MNSDILTPADGAILYLRELADVQKSLTSLLDNIKRLIEDLPDDRDHESLLNNLQTIHVKLDRIYTELHDNGNKAFHTYELLQKDISKIVNTLDMLIDKLNVIDKSKYDEHLKDINDIKTLLLSDKHNLSLNLKDLNFFVTKINQIFNNLSIKYGTLSPCYDDIQTVVDFARRSKERWDWWTPRKRAIIWISGIMTSIILFFNKFIYIFDFLKSILDK